LVAALLVCIIPSTKNSCQGVDTIIQSNLPGQAEGVALSPAGDLMATAGFGKCVLLWAIPSGKLIRRIEAATYPIAFSPNGRALAARREGKDVVLFDTRSGASIGSYRGPAEPIHIEFDEKPNTIAVSYGTKQILTWDLPSGRMVKQFSGFAPFAMSLDGGQLAAATKSGVSVWNLKSGNQMGSPQQLKCVAFSRGARIAVCAEGDSYFVYDLTKRARLVSLEKVDSELRRGVTFSTNGKFIVRRLQNGLGVWEPQTGKHVRDLMPGSEMMPDEFSIATANNLVAISLTDGVKVFDIGTGEQITELKADDVNTTGVTFSGNETILHIDPTAGIAEWDLRSGRRVARRPISDVPGWIFSAAINSKIAAVTTANDVLAWTSGKGNGFQSLNIHDTNSLHIAAIPNSDNVLFGNGEKLILAHAQPGDQLFRVWNSETAVMEALAVDPEGKYAVSAGYKKRSIKLWDLSTGDEVVGLTQLPSDAVVLAFSRQGDKLAAEFSPEHIGKRIIIWTVPDLNRVAQFSVEERAVGMAFDWNAGRFAVLTNTGFVKLFDLPSGKVRKTLLSADCDTLAINHTAKLLVCGGRNQNFVRLWQLGSGEFVGDLYSIGAEDWIVEGPGGYFDCSKNALDRLTWAASGRIDSSEKFRQSRRVPGLLTRAVEK
jgi:WD40 repeat protein